MRLNKILSVAAVAVAASMFGASEAEARGPMGQAAFARSLNAGPLRHAPGAGAEVVFRTSNGRATKAQAMAAWRASTAGHAQLVSSGQIRRVVCRGGVCVGR